MKKIIITLILLAVVGAGIFYFINKGKINTLCESGFRFVPSTQKCEPFDEVNHENALQGDFSKVTMYVPETNIPIQLTKDGQREGVYVGKYESKDGKQKGGVTLDTKNIVEYSSDLALVPFIINGTGTGQFYYVGLFDIKNNIQLSSVFIGDRVEIGTIIVSGEKIKINYKNRLDSEAMVAKPTIANQLIVEIKDQKLVEFFRLQNADYSDVELKTSLPLVVKNGDLSLRGSIPGTWYFEAIAGFKIFDDTYNEISTGSITALSDWMTTQRVPFELATTTVSYKGKGTILIQSENVQGGDEGEKKVRKLIIPVTFQ